MTVRPSRRRISDPSPTEITSEEKVQITAEVHCSTHTHFARRLQGSRRVFLVDSFDKRRTVHPDRVGIDRRNSGAGALQRRSLARARRSDYLFPISDLTCLCNGTFNQLDKDHATLSHVAKYGRYFSLNDDPDSQNYYKYNYTQVDLAPGSTFENRAHTYSDDNETLSGNDVTLYGIRLRPLPGLKTAPGLKHVDFNREVEADYNQTARCAGEGSFTSKQRRIREYSMLRSTDA